MWNSQYPGNSDGYPPPAGPPMPGGAPSFPNAPGFPSPGFPTPGGGGAPGYNPGYSPGYGGGYAPPPGGPPPGPPGGSSYPGQHHHHHHNQQPPSFAPPPGAPPGGYRSPAGPPPGGYPSPAGPPLGGYPSPAGPPPGGAYNSPSGPPPVPPRMSNAGPPGVPPRPGGGQYPPPPGPPPRPPTQQQNYGPTMEGPDHRQTQPFFQYSQCTGKKKALCIGINYFGQSAELKGCINDANNVKRFLCSQFGYKPDDIVMLTDDAQNPRQIPTKQNMLQAMQWLVRDARPNDSLFFHYSGHGGQTKDLDGEEADGYDEVIYPVDFKQNGHIVDDTLHDLLVKPLPPGCRLTAIFDSCHSGSVLDLPYLYSTEGKIKEPNLAAEAGQGLMSAVSSYARGDMGGVFGSVSGLLKTATGSGQRAEKKARATKTSPADVIAWSGCKDSQTSADTFEAGQATGAMSFAFISALGQNSQQSYQQLLTTLRGILRNKYSQKPQLSASHPIDTSLLFMC
ncbi:caspase family protein [Phanerochaete sordida]|uniref:Caspase family protein n=1 Tax=Phanerochaete sordida TaxID=48140 RepID=A0A9P3LAY7_9APHY|nr:caspase family protein [Phanerochaete sordida]